MKIIEQSVEKDAHQTFESLKAGDCFKLCDDDVHTLWIVNNMKISIGSTIGNAYDSVTGTYGYVYPNSKVYRVNEYVIVRQKKEE